MLESLYVDNFKSLVEFHISFPEKLTVLIGSNSVGKSTVLQAVDLLPYFANARLHDYLGKHNWKPNELRSKLYPSSKRNIVFKAGVCKEQETQLSWEFILTVRKDELVCTHERVIDKNRNNQVIMSRDNKILRWFDFSKQKYELFPEIQLSGSMLSLIDTSSHDFIERFPQLCLLKRFISGIKSFELLSPEHMKKSSRYDATDLGIGGERLASFLHNLSQSEKDKINEKLKECYSSFDGLVTRKRQYGYVQLNMREQFGGTEPYEIKANYVSDGLLRIIAIISLGALDETYTGLLLDEIEDGINPNLAAELIEYLITISKSNHEKQVFVTTHSPVMLNYFDPNSIVFLWRDEKGKVWSQSMFKSQELAEHLEYMNPGEVWLNIEQSELERSLRKTLESRQESETHDA